MIIFLLAQAMLYRRRGLEIYEFEYGLNNNYSCTFRQIRPVMKILLIEKKLKSFNSKILLQKKTIERHFDGRNLAKSYGERSI